MPEISGIYQVSNGFGSDIELQVLALADKLQQAGVMCATAESCTGGWIAQTLTSVAGSSAWFDCGFVTYSNESKRRLLGIDANVIERFGAVSEEVAVAMAAGAVEKSDADVAVAVTGIAGPDGGTAGKPVGTVVFGWLVPGMTSPDVETLLFPGDRRDIRWATVLHAVAGLNDRL
jgi:nicotinamide-nucleotide amidase